MVTACPGLSNERENPTGLLLISIVQRHYCPLPAHGGHKPARQITGHFCLTIKVPFLLCVDTQCGQYSCGNAEETTRGATHALQIGYDMGFLYG